MRKTFSIIISVLMVLSLCVVGISADDATKVTTAAEFLAMQADGNYILDADIVVTASYGAGETPTAFVGTFDGNGHTITVSGAPMFADLGKAVIKNLTIEGSIESDTNVGALATTCSARTFEEFSDYAVIEKCVNKANVTMTVPDTAEKDSYWGVGGFIGKSADDCGAMFVECVNEGAITVKCTKTESCRFYAGGFAGLCDTFLARNSENKGDVKFDGDYANCLGQDGCAGFVGRVAKTPSFNYCNIEYCVNNGNIKGARYAGGFLGYSGLGSNTCQYLMDNTPYRFFGNINNGDIEGKNWAGGIAGYCYCNGTNDAQTFDIEFNLVNGKIVSDKWCAPFVGYSNSTKNILMYNVSTAEFAKRTEEAASFMFVFLGCSSSYYKDNTTFQHNYIVDEGGLFKYLTYAEDGEKYPNNRIEIAWGIDNNYVTIVTPAQLATGEITYKINSAAQKNGFNQTLGTDQAPTPSLASSYVVKDGNNYKNAATAEFDAFELIDITKAPETTKTETTAKATTAEVTTAAAPTETTAAAPTETTAAPTDVTTAAPKDGGCKSVIGIGVAIVAVLGAAYVSKKKKF
ncbi:MAG: hypothetical protein K5647_10175 [Clostridiales bacterium]|nr:hypothetical protein [Clostridiales bacterium]